MQPGNLVFLVIVAIWAVYLVQHWIRRREHVATARSVDRFSEAMRVLERRAPLPRADLASPHPASYAVRPASARPALVVKRAPTVSASLAARMVADEPVGAGTRGSARRGSGGSGGSGPSGGFAGAGGSGSSSSGPAHSSGPVGRAPRDVLIRRVRGIAFLVTLAAIPVTLVLSIAHVLLWESVAIAFAAFVVVVAGLRAAMRRDQSIRRAARAAARRRYAPPAAASSTAASSTAASRTAASRSATAAASAAAAVPAAPVPSPNWDETASSMTGSHPTSQGPSEVYDVTAYVARPGEPSTTPWNPVPVPPPTYTLKDTAVRPAPEPADVSQVPVPIEVEDDELERLMAQRHRRVVG